MAATFEGVVAFMRSMWPYLLPLLTLYVGWRLNERSVRRRLEDARKDKEQAVRDALEAERKRCHETLQDVLIQQKRKELEAVAIRITNLNFDGIGLLAINQDSVERYKDKVNTNRRTLDEVSLILQDYSRFTDTTTKLYKTLSHIEMALDGLLFPHEPQEWERLGLSADEGNYTIGHIYQEIRHINSLVNELRSGIRDEVANHLLRSNSYA